MHIKPLTNRSVLLPDNAHIFFITTPQNDIIYVNSDFSRISGYSQEELLGCPYHCIKHPDMPDIAFQQMWQTLKCGKPWMGMMKNRCKNGDHFWASSYAMPVVQDGKILEYQFTQTHSNPAQIHKAEEIYAKIQAGSNVSSRWGMLQGLKAKVFLILVLAMVSGFFLMSSLTSLPFKRIFVVSIFEMVFILSCLIFVLSPLDKLTKRATKIVSNSLSQAVYTGRYDEFGQVEFALSMVEAEVKHLWCCDRHGMSPYSINEATHSVQTANRKMAPDASIAQPAHLNIDALEDEILQSTDLMRELAQRSEEISLLLDKMSGNAIPSKEPEHSNKNTHSRET